LELALVEPHLRISESSEGVELSADAVVDALE
jgi:hypothetical protein